MKKINLLLLLLISLLQIETLSAQYTATDFTVTDLDGNEHHLFQYLDEGKSVLLAFFTPWCDPCAELYETGLLDIINLERGPGSSENDVVVIALESDPNTDDYWTLGGTVPDYTDVSFPTVDMKPEDFAAMSAYNQWLQYWPTVLAICPDRTMNEITEGNSEYVLSYLIVPEVNAGQDGEINCYQPTIDAYVSDLDKDYIYFNWTELLPNGSATNPPFPYDELNPEVTETGTFVLSAININTGCGGVDTIIISEINLDPPLLYVEEDSLVLSCLSDTIDIFSYGLFGAGIWERSWETADGNIVEITDTTAHHIIVEGAGTYVTTTFDNLNGCSSTDSVVVVDAPQIELLSYILENTQPGQSNGSISLEVTGGTGTLDYAWDNGSVSAHIDELPAGNYTGTITDENGCELIVGPYQVMDGLTSTYEISKEELLARPNPTNGIFSLNLPDGFKNQGVLKIFNLNGNQVDSRQLSEGSRNVEIDFSEMPAGIYQVVLQSRNEVTIGRVAVVK